MGRNIVSIRCTLRATIIPLTFALRTSHSYMSRSMRISLNYQMEIFSLCVSGAAGLPTQLHLAAAHGRLDSAFALQTGTALS